MRLLFLVVPFQKVTRVRMAWLVTGSGANHLSEKTRRVLAMGLFLERASDSLRLAEVMTVSQDGSHTLQACGIPSICPAVSFARPVVLPDLDRKGTCGPLRERNCANPECLPLRKPNHGVKGPNH